MSEIKKMNELEADQVAGGDILPKEVVEEIEHRHSSTRKCQYCGKEYKLYDWEIFNDACHECRKIPLKDRVIKS